MGEIEIENMRLKSFPIHKNVDLAVHKSGFNSGHTNNLIKQYSRSVAGLLRKRTMQRKNMKPNILIYD